MTAEQLTLGPSPDGPRENPGELDITTARVRVTDFYEAISWGLPRNLAERDRLRKRWDMDS